MAGRPRKVISEEVLLAWSSSGKNRTKLQEVQQTEQKLKGFYVKSCGRHLGLCTPKWLTSHPTEAFNCAICIAITGKHFSGKVITQHELEVAGYLSELFGRQGFIYQAKVVDRHNAPIDFYVPDINLLIQVDGEQHFDIKYKNTTVKHQQQLDLKCDTRAIEMGFNLLRLHFKDIESTDYLLQNCKELAQRSPGNLFVGHSPSYGKDLTNNLSVKWHTTSKPTPQFGDAQTLTM